MSEYIVKSIDSSLRYVDSFHSSTLTNIFKVERQRQLYVLKLCQVEFPGAYKHICNEKKALERAKDVDGITHLVEDYGLRGEFVAILKEYFDGKDLDELRTFTITNKAIQEQLERTVTEMHERGVACLDVKYSNIILSPDGKHAKMVDLGTAVFSEQHNFEFFKSQDLRWLIHMFG